MRKGPILSALILVSTFINTVPTYAVTVTATGTNPAVCNQDVGNASSVVAYRLAGGDCVVEFKNVGTTTWTVPIGVTSITYLVIAGGGGGAGGQASEHGGGGGGAGGLRSGTLSVASGSVNITVGSGGSAGAANSVGTNGTDSSLNNSIIATGGGRGGTYFTNAASTGGSGGGAGSSASLTTGANGTVGQGTKGGNVTSSGTNGRHGGGGGGAGNPGGDTTNSGGVTITAGAGGSGASSTITGTSLNYGGGGGGGGSSAVVPATGGASGGSGGGGNGATFNGSSLTSAATKGTDNTGGGGGGGIGIGGASASVGGAGGSGVVILSYSTTITPTYVLGNYGPTTNCIWDTRQNYATLLQAGTTNTVTQVRLQFEANAQISTFQALTIRFYTNNAGVAGTLIGTLRPSTLAAASIAAGSSINTRVGTFTGSVNLVAGTQYWYEVASGGSILSMCASNTAFTQVSGWSIVLNGGNYNLRTNGNYSTWPEIFQFEMTVGNPDVTAPVISGTSGNTAASLSINTPENATWSDAYTANEWVAWSITGADSATFTINQSGAISLGAKNFEVRTDANLDGIFQVTVRATDSPGNVGTQALSITIDDDNDAPVITIAGGAATHAVTVAENQTSVITYTGSDEDTGTTLGWYFANSSFDATKFNLNVATGVLTFKVAPDFENPTDTNRDNVYKVNIGLFDGAVLVSQMLSVTISNINETTSIATPSISANVFKGVVVTITVVADTPGAVRFFVNGKKIPNCLARATTGSAPTATSTCSWKPPVHGIHRVTARLTPTNVVLAQSTSAPLSILVGSRTGVR